MTSPLADRFRRWFDFERESHGQVLASLEGVPAEGRAKPEFQKALGLLAHVVMARGVWLSRLGGGPKPPGPLFPQDCELAGVRDDWKAMEARWLAYLSGLDDQDLARTVDYQMLDGSPASNTVEEMLTQLFGHSIYHRGQIAMLVKAAGGFPATTDFIHWLRRGGLSG